LSEPILTALALLIFAAEFVGATWLLLDRSWTGPVANLARFFAALVLPLWLILSVRVMASGDSWWPAFAAIWLAQIVVAVRAWRRRRLNVAARKRPGERGVMEYLFVTAVLVTWHAILARLAGDFDAGAGGRYVAQFPVLSAERLASEVTLFVVFFSLSQLSTARAIAALHGPLRREWLILEGSRYRRVVLLLLGAAPVVACLVPAVAHRALLLGVSWRLAVLFGAWWRDRGCLPEHDADFLRAPLRLALEQLMRGRRRRRLTARSHDERSSADPMTADPAYFRLRELSRSDGMHAPRTGTRSTLWLIAIGGCIAATALQPPRRRNYGRLQLSLLMLGLVLLPVWRLAARRRPK
jgi:hypothetical protein